jgi:imidazoleglycerol-phosphate dehydratase
MTEARGDEHVPPRRSEIRRATKETTIELDLDLDGSGRGSIASGVGFLDHMLDGFSRHGACDLTVRCAGDVQVDDHHSTEDIGICLGMAIDEALADRAGIRRYGHAILPMDEALVMCAIDLGGRPFFSWDAPMPTAKVGTFDSELAAEFWRSVATLGRMNLHVKLLSGSNTHHVIEATFKGIARALRDAWEPDPRCGGVPSTKGSL